MDPQQLLQMMMGGQQGPVDPLTFGSAMGSMDPSQLIPFLVAQGIEPPDALPPNAQLTEGQAPYGLAVDPYARNTIPAVAPAMPSMGMQTTPPPAPGQGPYAIPAQRITDVPDAIGSIIPPPISTGDPIIPKTVTTQRIVPPVATPPVDVPAPNPVTDQPPGTYALQPGQRTYPSVNNPSRVIGGGSTETNAEAPEGSSGKPDKENRTSELMKMLTGVRAPAAPEIQKITTPRPPEARAIPAQSALAELLLKLQGANPQAKDFLRLGSAIGR